MVLINDIDVDIAAISSISHNCNPTICNSDESCCSSYEVYINRRELSQIIGFFPYVVKFTKNIWTKSGYLNVFEEINKNSFLIDTDENGVCIFAYRKKHKGYFCSLHSAAIDLGIFPDQIKPKNCMLWPLALSKSKPKLLSVQDDALSFPCNKLRKIKNSFLDKGIINIIISFFGNRFYSKLRDIYLNT